MNWFTADLHLGHENISAYCGRPYYSADAMNRDLVRLWNEVVEPDDEVVILGDLAMGRISETLPLVERLAGRKTLLPGNHDRCWPGHRRRKDDPARWLREYEAVGLQIVYALSTTVGAKAVRASHFPYSGDSQSEDRFAEHRLVDSGAWLLHGHVHDAWRQRGLQINVGVDAWAGRPVSEHELEALIHEGPRDLGRLPWD